MKLFKGGGGPVWKFFDADLLDDGTISWQGVGESLLTGSNLRRILFGGAVMALAAQFLF
jgi:hypothetical protein